MEGKGEEEEGEELREIQEGILVKKGGIFFRAFNLSGLDAEGFGGSSGEREAMDEQPKKPKRKRKG